MNLSKLLSLDRSFSSFGNGMNRYRMGKDNLLPEFGNGALQKPGDSPALDSPVEVSAPRPKRELYVLGFRIPLPFLKPLLTPFGVRMPSPGAKPSLQGGIALQTEVIANRKSNLATQLLSQVKVVRNDLANSGVEVLPLRRPPASEEKRVGIEQSLDESALGTVRAKASAP